MCIRDRNEGVCPLARQRKDLIHSDEEKYGVMSYLPNFDKYLLFTSGL